MQKKLAFYFITLMIPFVFLALLEGGLRVFNYGEDQPAVFVTDRIDSDYLYLNPLVAQRYFPVKEFATVGPYDVFLKNKTDSTIRIFVQGASSSAGFPYYAASFPRLLEQKLSHFYSNKNVEVINASLVATNSFTLLDFADEIIAQKPDMVIIYAGHNEYYGALGVGSSQSFARSTALTNLYIKLKEVRLIQLIKSLVKPVKKPTDEQDRQTLMANMVQEESIPYRSKAYQGGVEQYKSNIGHLLKTYEKAGIPVFICTIVSNAKDFKPFESSSGDEFDADAAFDKGQGLIKENRIIEAKEQLVNAKDFDLLRFRAPTAIETLIPELAVAHNAMVIDMKSAFEKESEFGIIGNDLLLEHVHANLKGQRLFADVAFKSVSEFLSQSGEVMSIPNIEFKYAIAPVDSFYATQLINRLMVDWPFVDQPESKSEKSKPETLDLILAGSMSLYDILNNSLTEDLQVNPGRALLTARVLMQEYPHQSRTYLSVADAYTKLGEIEAAGFVLQSIPKKLITLDIQKRILRNLIEQNAFDRSLPLAKVILETQNDRYNRIMLESIQAMITSYSKQNQEAYRVATPELAIKDLEALMFLEKMDLAKGLYLQLIKVMPNNPALLEIGRKAFD